MILLAKEILGINTTYIRDSETGNFPNNINKTDMLINSINRAVNSKEYDEIIYLPRNHPIPTDFYLNKKYGESKITELEKFLNSEISVQTYNYTHPKYKQYQIVDKSDFIPNLSIFDLIFNKGPESLDILLSGGDDKYIKVRR